MDIWYTNLLFDPQTSGGLLISIPENEVEKYIKTVAENYPLQITPIGEISEGENKIVIHG